MQSEVAEAWENDELIPPRAIGNITSSEEDLHMWRQWQDTRTSERVWYRPPTPTDQIEIAEYGLAFADQLFKAGSLRVVFLDRSDETDYISILKNGTKDTISSAPRSPLMIQKDLDLAPCAVVFGFDISTETASFSLVNYRQRLQKAGAAGAAAWARGNQLGYGSCFSPGVFRSKLPSMGISETEFSVCWAGLFGRTSKSEENKEVKK